MLRFAIPYVDLASPIANRQVPPSRIKDQGRNSLRTGGWFDELPAWIVFPPGIPQIDPAQGIARCNLVMLRVEGQCGDVDSFELPPLLRVHSFGRRRCSPRHFEVAGKVWVSDFSLPHTGNVV